MQKIIGLTYDLKEHWDKKDVDPGDINAEFDHPKTIDIVQAAIEAGGHQVKRIGNVHELLTNINNLSVDIVFNIAEGYYGRNRESQVPMLLELHNIPYVGSDALTLGITLDKVLAKKLFISEGIPTAKFFTANCKDDVAKLNTIGYPLMVKTRHEGSSKGIDEGSRVTNLKELRERVEFINNTYHQQALVEQFVSGKEFTVAVIGNDNPRAMPVVQVSIDGSVDLGDKFYTFERITANSLRYICPAQISEKLQKQIQEIALKVYNCVECKDFARVDFRVDKDDNIYVLEVNPLPCLMLEDVFNIFPQVMGSTYTETINKILNLALQRYNLH